MVNKVISLIDLNEKEDEIEHYIDMTDFYSEDYVDILKHLKPITVGNVDVTLMDLFNIPLKTDKEIIELIKQRLNIDINTQDGINKINELFSKTRDLYEERYLKSLPIKIKKLNFKTPISIISFLRETKTNKKSGAINCALAKISYAVDDVLSNEKVRRAYFLDKQFISEHLEKPFQIEEGFEDKNGNIFRNGKCVIDGHIINFKIISRQKSQDSIIGKQLGDSKYYSVNEFLDLVGATIYVEKDHEAALMMQYIDQMIFSGKAKIKNKNGLNLNAVKRSTYLNEEFYLKLEEQTKVKQEESEEEIEYNQRKNITSENYREIKLVGNVDLSLEEGARATKYPVGTEIKFVIGGHDNEKGLSLQSIYDYLKRFKELTRLGIPTRKIDIINYVNDFFENIDEILKKKNKEKIAYFNELYKDLFDLGFISEPILFGTNQINEKTIALGLYKYFESKLIKIKISHSKKEYYFDENILNMRDSGLYKKAEKI